MPLGMQGWVNGWVKVNAKHVVFPRDGHASSEPGSVTEQQRPLSRRKSDRNDRRGGDTATTASSSLRQPREDHELGAIRRLNSRKNRRRLQRTISHTDLLREMALSKEKRPDEQEAGRRRQEGLEAKTTGSNVSGSSKHHSSHSTSVTVQHANQHVEDDVSSHATSSGFFDTASEAKRLPHPSTTGKYLNETAFVQQYEQSRHTEAKSNHRLTSGSGTSTSRERKLYPTSREAAPRKHLNHPRSHGRRTPDVSRDGSDPSRSPAASLRRGSSSVSKDESSSESGKVELRRAHLNGAPAARATMNGADDSHHGKPGFLFQPPWVGPTARSNVAESKPCSYCEEAEGRLLAVQADLEYLRSVSLRNEYICNVCENASLSKRKKKYSRGASASNSESIALNEASQRLVEVTARHKRQIESMMRERVRCWIPSCFV